jgi:hypothetical protein
MVIFVDSCAQSVNTGDLEWTTVSNISIRMMGNAQTMIRRSMR